MTQPNPTDADTQAAAAMETLVLDQPGARARGLAHGEHWRASVGALVEITWARAAARLGTDALTAAAVASLDVMARETAALHEELVGIAQGAGVSPECIVVLNGGAQGASPAGTAKGEAVPVDLDSGDTSIYFNGVDGPVLGQTFDVHPSIAPWLRLLHLRPADQPEQLLLTMPGGLGMAGLTGDGLAVTSLALALQDRAPALPWPAVIRSLLGTASAADAHAALQGMTLSCGGYVIAADGRDFLGSETSARRKFLTQTGARAAHLHTNHCFDPVLRQTERIPDRSTTFARLDLASTIYAQQRPKTADALWQLLHTHDTTRGTLCSHGAQRGAGLGDGVADGAGDACDRPTTAAIVVMRLAARSMRVVAGCERRGQPIERTASPRPGEAHPIATAARPTTAR